MPSFDYRFSRARSPLVSRQPATQPHHRHQRSALDQSFAPDYGHYVLPLFAILAAVDFVGFVTGTASALYSS
ncbi:Uncharacterised protein [Vibrio cholerae]|nr:Uncharacterised protein [Vibrio cholerae]